MRPFIAVAVVVFIAGAGPREALKPLGSLVGSWTGTGEPAGSKAEKRKGFWKETVRCAWHFEKDAASLRFEFEKGKHFKSAELTHLPDKKQYRFVAKTAKEETWDFQGTFEDRILTVERSDKDAGETQRLVITLLHDNRFLYRFETKGKDQKSFQCNYKVGATKQGEAFATGDGKPECIVTGGAASIEVKYKGKTYYVCCTGCRDAFLADPEKYIKEAEEKQKSKK